MISWDFDPLYVRGGTAYAIRRLADQLTGLGVESKVFFPARLEIPPGNGFVSLLKPIPVKMGPEFDDAPRVVQCAEFCRLALSAIEKNTDSEPVISHSDEGAMFIVLRNGRRSGGPSVFWLHSLYDPPLDDLRTEHRRLLPSSSLLASAVMMADIVVTSTGVLKDAVEFAWPENLRELQRALTAASAEQRVLTVESTGCLAAANHQPRSSPELQSLESLPSPYVLFPGRPSVDKGLGIFAAIAARLRDDNIACVAVQRPDQQDKSHSPANGLVHWLPWLPQEELIVAMRNSMCTVLPSVTEGFGLAAAESISLGVSTLYHQVGGHHALQEFSHARQVPLTLDEKSQLYQLWSELVATNPDSWSVWSRYEPTFQPLVDKWVDAIRTLRHQRNGNGATFNFVTQPVETERWADKLCRRLEAASALEFGHSVKPDGRPRLVHVLPWDLTVGGAQRMLDTWCSHEADRWKTYILSAGARGPFAFAGATVHSDLSRQQIQALVEQLQPDVLVHHEPSEKSGIKSTCPQIWILHCTDSLRQQPPRHAQPELVFSNFDSNEIDPAWRQLPLKVVRLQLDTTQFQPGNRNHIGLVCGIVGRLHEDKVPRSFVEALRVWEPGPWRIRFIGHGLDTGYQRYVKSQLTNLSWVEFLDDVAPDQMPAALHELTAVMVPTDATVSETGSYAALEAMATGLPVVARDLCGLRYNCGDGPLYAHSDQDLLARLRSLDDEEVRSAVGERSRQAVMDHTVQSHTASHSAGFSAALRREVSILLPVFETPRAYLAECWNSICRQTFRQWELVLVDDGSRSAETIAELDRIARDPRVVLVRLEQNHGIAHALNVGLAKCRANFVARMDADDVMLPTRLERQVNYLLAHSEVTVLGTQMQAIEWKTERMLSPTDHPEEVTEEFITHQRQTSEIWFLNHPTVMLRRKEVMDLGGYPEYRVAQDLGLWLKVFAAGHQIHNLPSVELHYRLHPNQISTAKGVRRDEYAAIVAECWTPEL